MAVTLKDIARECGLAVSTVSNILNNNSTSFASDAVRQKVKDTAERLGYKRDYLSSSLRTRRTHSIGLILDKIDDPTRQDFLVPFVEHFSAQGYEVALAEHRHDLGRALSALEGFSERCKDGVVLFSDLLGRPEEDQKALAQAVIASPLKVIAVGSGLRGQVPSLDIDRGHSVERSIKLFTDRGLPTLVVYEFDYDMRPAFNYWDRPGVTFWGDTHTPEDFFSRLDREGLGETKAIFFRTDRIAIPALKALQSKGFRIPQDLEVISFDNFPFSQHTQPALSTWDIGFHRLGLRSQELMLRWLEGDAPDAGHFELFEPDFVSRLSHRSLNQEVL